MTNIFLLLLFAFANSQTFTKDAHVYKCLCDWDHVQDPSGSCVPSDKTYIAMWNATAQNSANVHLRNAPTVTKTPLTCPVGYHKITYQEIADILPNGYLIPPYPEPRTDKYCLENTISEDGSPGQWYEFCLQYEPFVFCCENDEVLTTDGNCVPAEIDLKLYNNFENVIKNINCDTGKATYEAVFPSDDVITMKSIYGYYDKKIRKCLGPYMNEDGSLQYISKSCPCEDPSTTCIASCCPPGEALDLDVNQCVSTDMVYNPINLQFPENVTTIPQNFDCETLNVLDFNRTEYSILKDGSLSTGNEITIPLNDYCLGIIDDGSGLKATGLTCFVEKEEQCLWRFKLVQVFLCISSAFIIITIIVYLSVKDLRNRTAFCLVNQLLALLVSQINLVVLQQYQETFSPGSCLAAGIIEIIFVLASFFWLNVMCFDVWNTFRVLRPYCRKSVNVKVFLKYSLYSWGAPVLIGMVALTTELLKANIRPEFEISKGCFFTTDSLLQQWVYLYSFIALILVVNSAFFLHLVIRVLPSQMKKRKSFKKKMSGKNECNSEGDLENLKLYGKLFIVMGLPWVIEVLTSFAPEHHTCYIWILDLFNMMRGVIIFVIFICNRPTIRTIKKNWLPKRFSGQDVVDSEELQKTNSTTYSS